MAHIELIADMTGRHPPHDVYDLRVEQRSACILVGWEGYDGRRYTFCILPGGGVQPVGRPPAAPVAGLETGVATVSHELNDDQSGRFRVVGSLPDGNRFVFEDPTASLLFPTACTAPDGTPWIAWVRCRDVENPDGVIDQINEIECVHLVGGQWVRETVADLRYGLLPKESVWGYPGCRRRPCLVPDDRGGVWVLWERKEPHHGPTTRAVGALCGRRFADGAWNDPVRLVPGGYVMYSPAPCGFRSGALVIAAQKAPADSGGQVVVLRIHADGAPPQNQDAGFGRWRTVHLPRRFDFRPQDRRVTHNEKTYSLLFGDPHTHTAFSHDAEGDLLELLAYARDKARLDFVAFTDNDCIYGGRLTDRDWRTTMETEQEWSENGRFIAVPGYEWTLPAWGPVRPQHRSILFASYDQPILRWPDVEGDPMDALTAWIATTDGIMNTQHQRFQLTRNEREANMEVCSGWGVYIEQSTCFHEHLDRGFRVGFIGASDGHRRTPGLGGGLTGLWIEEFTLSGIIAALRARRCYATAGAGIGLKFWIGNAFMGEVLQADDPVAARVAVEAPRPIRKVEIIGDGRVLAVLEGLGNSCEEEINDVPPCSWYYAKVTLQGDFPDYPSNIAPAEGPWAWSSPVFRTPPHQGSEICARESRTPD